MVGWPLGPVRSDCTRPSCGSCAVFCGHSAPSHSARKLGVAHACVFALSWTARPCAKLLCCFGGLPPLSPLLPAEPRLLNFYASATSRVIRLFRHWGYQSGSERVSPLHLSARRTSGQTQPSTNGVTFVPVSNHGVRGTRRKPVLGLAPGRLLTLAQARLCSRPLGRWPLGLSMSWFRQP